MGIANAKEVKQEREEIEKKVAEQMELERQRKADQVQLMRAEGEISREEKKNAVADKFDPTTTSSASSGKGVLLGEMSYIDMKERMLLNESKQRAQTEERRVKIIEKKLDKEKEIREKAEQLQRIRHQARREAEDRKSKKKADEKEAARLQKEEN